MVERKKRLNWGPRRTLFVGDGHIIVVTDTARSFEKPGGPVTDEVGQLTEM